MTSNSTLKQLRFSSDNRTKVAVVQTISSQEIEVGGETYHVRERLLRGVMCLLEAQLAWYHTPDYIRAGYDWWPAMCSAEGRELIPAICLVEAGKGSVSTGGTFRVTGVLGENAEFGLSGDFYEEIGLVVNPKERTGSPHGMWWNSPHYEDLTLQELELLYAAAGLLLLR